MEQRRVVLSHRGTGARRRAATWGRAATWCLNHRGHRERRGLQRWCVQRRDV